MKKLAFGLLAGLVISLAAPLWANEVYVPYVANITTAEGHKIEFELRVTNDGAADNDFHMFFIPKDRDGTRLDRETGAERVSLKSNQSVRLRELVNVSKYGFLEISTSDDVAVSARLRTWNAKGAERLGAEMPVVDKKSSYDAGEVANLIGLARIPNTRETDFYLLNLGTSRANCSIEIYRRLGKILINQTINVSPLSMTPYVDVFGLIGEDNVTEHRIAVTCDQRFYPFAIKRDLNTANILFVSPSASGSNGLNILGSVSCPSDALFHRPGIFHIPVRGNPFAHFIIRQQGGLTFRRLILDLTFTHGGWVSPTSDQHNLFWLQRNSKWTGNVFGYLNAHGPNRNLVKLETNVDLPKNRNVTGEDRVELEPGKTYRVHYVYDTTEYSAEVTITSEDGAEVAHIVSAATVGAIQTIDQGWLLQFGNPADAGSNPEVPTWGWKYADACIQLE